MNEDVLRQLLGEMMESEFAKYDNPPKWKFSLKHRLAMKCIFMRYERNVKKLNEKTVEHPISTERRRTHLDLKQHLIIVLIIVFLLTLTGCVVAAFISKNFHGTVYKDNTLIFPVNLENAPLTIEYTYTLNSAPEGFELIETDLSPTNSYSLYKNTITKQTITLSQWVKSYYTPHVNTEHHMLEEIDINGYIGLCVDFSNEECNKTLLVWDNGDYIIEVLADLAKEDAVNLLTINKL